MVARVRLIQEDNRYVVFTYFDSNLKFPNLLTPFLYNDGNQEQVLEQARDFGRDIAKAHNTRLEEELQQPT